jgi:anti-anti-sigma factor
VVESNENECQVTILDHICRVSIPPTFTVKKAVEFKQAFKQACKSNPGLSRAELDFSETRFMDSSGMGALVAAHKLAKEISCELVLQNVSQQVMTALSLADLDKLFLIDNVAQKLPLLGETPSPSVDVSEPPSPPIGLHRLSNRTKHIDQPFITHPSVKSRSKRIIDVIGAIIGLAITGIVFVPIAIAIKLDSPGPIFFGQVRCSRMSRRFKMWKFRSMQTDAEAKKHLVKNEAEGAIFKAANDPRITRVGRFLRKTSLDELPQFWNVLKGEMSLVGTRPPTPDEVDKYEIDQWQRLDIKPGMTGEWQVNGRSSVKKFEDIVQLDLKYQQNWSLSYDMQLILKTILVIFNKKSGAM